MTTPHDSDPAPGPDRLRPLPGQFFRPVEGSWNDPDGPFVAGDAQIVLHRVGKKKFKVPERFGYCDPESGESWVIPRNPATYESDLSSAPVLVQWIVPIHGRHFNAWMVHDGLVEDELFDPENPSEGAGYFGKKVSREEADRIARDAIGELGGGFIMRWLAWVGMLAATVLTSGEGIVGSKWQHRILFVLFSLVYLGLGTVSTFEMFGAGWGWLPWLESDNWATLVALGFGAAVLIPLGLSVVWGKRWRFAAILGISFAILLPSFVLTGTFSAITWLADKTIFRWTGLTRPSPT